MSVRHTEYDPQSPLACQLEYPTLNTGLDDSNTEVQESSIMDDWTDTGE